MVTTHNTGQLYQDQCEVRIWGHPTFVKSEEIFWVGFPNFCDMCVSLHENLQILYSMSKCDHKIFWARFPNFCNTCVSLHEGCHAGRLCVPFQAVSWHGEAGCQSSSREKNDLNHAKQSTEKQVAKVVLGNKIFALAVSVIFLCRHSKFFFWDGLKKIALNKEAWRKRATNFYVLLRKDWEAE